MTGEMAAWFFARLFVASLDVAVVAVLAWGMLWLWRPRSARLRSMVWLMVPLAGLSAFVWTPVTLAAFPTGAVSSALPVLSGAGGATVVWLVTLWSVGAGMQLLLSVLDRIRARHLLRRASIAPPDLRSEVENLGRAVGWRRPQAAVTADVDSPCVVGAVRPVVLLPVDLGTGDARQWAIRHEVTHVALRDPWAALLFEVARVVLFFHPALWLARRRWAAAAEEACDRAVVRDADESLAYAEQLHALARSLRQRKATAAAGLFAVTSDLGRRIELLIEPPVGSPRLSRRARCAMGVVTAFVVSSGAVAPSATVSVSTSSDDRATASDTEAPAWGWSNRFEFYIGEPPSDRDGGIVWETTFHQTTR